MGANIRVMQRLQSIKIQTLLINRYRPFLSTVSFVQIGEPAQPWLSVSEMIRQRAGCGGWMRKRDWTEESLWNTLVLLHSLLVVERGMKLLCWVSGWLWMPWGATLPVHSVKRDCRCELQMNNRSFSLSVKPFSHAFISLHVYLSFCPSLLSLISPPLSSTVLIIFSLSSRADWMHQRGFPYASSWESAVALIAEWWAGSHIWQPLAGKSPAQPPPSPPPPLWSWLDRDLSLAFTPPETTKPIQNQNTEGRSVFHLAAEQRLHMLLLKGFSALRCNPAFINYQLIRD